MKRTDLNRHPCSIARTLDVVGEWWTPLILRDVAYGIGRFQELQDDLGISTNVLSDRLETLLESGLLERRLYQRSPDRHEYVLTEKGADLVPALLALMRWGDKWTWADTGGPVRVVHEECGHEVTLEIRCPECERATEVSELRARGRRGIVAFPAGGEPGHLSARRLAGAPGGVGLSEPRGT